MTRLIDADAFKSMIFRVPYNKKKDGYIEGILDILSKINNAPTLDAFPVVRCKDCKWWDKKDDAPYGYCMAMKHGFVSSHWEIGIYRTYKGDFYCADGERREEDE